MCNKRMWFWVFVVLIFISGCGGKKPEKIDTQTIRITIRGLDGQGAAEGQLRKALDEIPGVQKISFDYLFDCLHVSYDSTKTTKASIVKAIRANEADKYKILQIESSQPPEGIKHPPTPSHKEDIISDDVDTYKNDV